MMEWIGKVHTPMTMGKRVMKKSEQTKNRGRRMRGGGRREEGEAGEGEEAEEGEEGREEEDGRCGRWKDEGENRPANEDVRGDDTAGAGSGLSGGGLMNKDENGEGCRLWPVLRGLVDGGGSRERCCCCCCPRRCWTRSAARSAIAPPAAKSETAAFFSSSHVTTLPAPAAAERAAVKSTLLFSLPVAPPPKASWVITRDIVSRTLNIFALGLLLDEDVDVVGDSGSCG